jgi:hypothetical protein
MVGGFQSSHRDTCRDTLPGLLRDFELQSMRVYISVVCMQAWLSHSETFRKSLVACKTVSAQACLSPYGDPSLADSILNRLVHNAHRLTLAGESKRKRRNGLTSKEVSE